ncbi:MAG: hypothetical protein HRU78_10070 [Gammaproteobacteria bacterium]|nr:MAG: hypothetical protein HRU78_10070 [Gammaproteobacteria bacterium]
MKKFFLLLTAVALVMLLSGFRAPNGNIISKGDLADKLLINMGEPHIRMDLGLVQTRAFGGIIYIKREVWTYRIDDYNYRFIIENGQIVADHWTRF